MMISVVRSSAALSSAIRRPASASILGCSELFEGQQHQQRASQQQRRGFAKAKKSKKTKSVDAGDVAVEKDLSKFVRMRDAPQRPDPHDEEEKQRRIAVGIAYNKGMRLRNNEEEAKLVTQLAMKWEAIDAVPEERNLKEKALVIDTTPFPISRQIASWTPPIKEFDKLVQQMLVDEELPKKYVKVDLD
jgi:hypothetical protein